MSKKAIFHIEGGVGKNIVATSVIRSYKKKNPKTGIIVTTAWPDVFQGNENVARCYMLGSTPYFYQDFIHEKDVEIFAHDPYKTTNHLTKKKQLAESWCELINTEYDGELPDLSFNLREKEIASKIISQNNKPILVFQPFGGPPNQEVAYSWMRDIHPTVAQEIVNKLKDKYNIVHICYPHHPQLQDVTRIEQNLNKKVLAAILGFSSQRILIDSSLQHAAAAMRLPSKVVWIGTQPELFGYGIHTNIKPSKEFPRGTINSYLFDYSFDGRVEECPYKEIEEIFNVELILEGL